MKTILVICLVFCAVSTISCANVLVVRHQRDVITAADVVATPLKELKPAVIVNDDAVVNEKIAKKDVAVKELKDDVVETIKPVESFAAAAAAATVDAADNIGVRQSVDLTTVRPGLIQQAQQTLTQLISNNPIANAINNIRQPPAPTPAPLEVVQLQGEVDEVTTLRPNLIQQFQTGVQSIQNQIQSVFSPSSASGGAVGGVGGSPNAAITVEPTTVRPGFIQQIQGAIVPPIQGFVNGIQTNLQNAQNQITGIFRPAAEPVIADAEPNVGGVIQTDGLDVTPIAGIDVVPQRIMAMAGVLPVVNQHIETVDNKVDAV